MNKKKLHGQEERVGERCQRPKAKLGAQVHACCRHKRMYNAMRARFRPVCPMWGFARKDLTVNARRAGPQTDRQRGGKRRRRDGRRYRSTKRGFNLFPHHFKAKASEIFRNMAANILECGQRDDDRGKGEKTKKGVIAMTDRNRVRGSSGRVRAKHHRLSSSQASCQLQPAPR